MRFSVFMVAVLLAAVCEAMHEIFWSTDRRAIGVEKPGYVSLDPIKYGEELTDSDKELYAEDDLEEDVDYDEWIPDFDDESEKMMSTLERLSDNDLPHRFEGRKKSKNFRAMMRKAGAKSAKNMMSPLKQCVDMEVKVENFCEKINFMKMGWLAKIHYRAASRKSGEKSGWIKCCELEIAEERLECFTEIKESIMNATCKSPKKPRMIKKCCKEEGKARVECFNKIKNRRCSLSTDSSETADLMSGVNQTMKCDYNISKWQVDDGKVSFMDRSMSKADKLKAKREMCKNHRMCCNAGTKSVANQTKRASCDVCSLNLDIWAEDQENVTDVCSQKFIWCCIHHGDGRLSRTISTNSTDVPPIVRRKNPGKSRKDYARPRGDYTRPRGDYRRHRKDFGRHRKDRGGKFRPNPRKTSMEKNPKDVTR